MELFKTLQKLSLGHTWKKCGRLGEFSLKIARFCPKNSALLPKNSALLPQKQRAFRWEKKLYLTKVYPKQDKFLAFSHAVNTQHRSGNERGSNIGAVTEVKTKIPTLKSFLRTLMIFANFLSILYKLSPIFARFLPTFTDFLPYSLIFSQL